MRVETPASLQEALELMASNDDPVIPVAGGTDLLVSWHHQKKTDLHLLDLSQIRPDGSSPSLSKPPARSAPSRSRPGARGPATSPTPRRPPTASRC